MTGIPLTRPVEYAKLTKKAKAMPLDSYIALAKYDGVCGIAVLDTCAMEAKMLSRTGEDYSVSCRALLDDLLAAARKAFPNYIGILYIMGEVWRPDCPQPTISGDFRRQSTGAVKDFHFVMFDIVQAGSLDFENRRYIARFTDLGTLALCAPANVYRARELARQTSLVAYEEQARTLCPGYDGLVLWYLAGMPLHDEKATGGEAIKFKPNITVDVRCTGGGVGEGKHAGRLGFLTYATWDGKTGSVGTGFSDAERESLWEGIVRGGLSSACGHIFEVEAMGYTPDGNLREPRFKGFRFDKKESD